MFEEHYKALVCGYLAALAGWAVIWRLVPKLWPAAEKTEFKRPRVELGFALAAVLGVLLLGALYSHGIRLRGSQPWRPLTESINQMAIFAPMLVLLPLRKQPWSTAWLARRKLLLRVGAGAVLTILAVATYSFCRKDSLPATSMLARIARYENLGIFVQVFIEDFSIAVLFVRMTAALGEKWSLVCVASLFAAAHVPAMMTGGALAAEFVRLAFDACLGVAVLAVVRSSRDIVWFALVHFCLDMTQFPAVTFGK